MRLITTALLGLILAHNAWACFPTPDAKPASTLSELRLPQRPYGPAVVFTQKKFAIYLRVEDLVALLEKQPRSVDSPGDLAEALSAKLPLRADLEVDHWLAVLAPRMPGPHDFELRTEVARDDLRFWRVARHQVGYLVAALLEQRKAAVIDLAKDQAVSTITLDRHNDVCSGGRRFMAPSGEVILQTSDWIS